MTTIHSFGGSWTEEKLSKLGHYLRAYTTIFKANPRAQYFTTYYVDAFAGTGVRQRDASESTSSMSLFQDDELIDVTNFYDGSARRALDTEPSFDRYLFIERRPTFAQELEKLRQEYPSKAIGIDIRIGDANLELVRWCNATNWDTTRAVLFLDSYGMSVEWNTLETVAKTGGIDVWILVPVGQAINRLLTRNELPTGSWANRLTLFFGTESWKTEFYRPRQASLLEELSGGVEKQATFESIADFFIRRLKTIFPHVSNTAYVLQNSRRNPLFVLCVAASNPGKGDLAIKIAGDILTRTQ